MLVNRVRLHITLEVDLDPTPGWGDCAADWMKLAANNLTLDTHYSPTVSIHCEDGGVRRLNEHLIEDKRVLHDEDDRFDIPWHKMGVAE